jgi:ABC-type sugar transport system permease subunit
MHEKVEERSTNLDGMVNLRFSMATAMAWILGSLLIGLTYFQIQFLSKIEYKRAT